MLATVASRNLTKHSPRNSGFFIGKMMERREFYPAFLHG